MSNINLSYYRKLFVAIAILAMVLLQGFHPATSARSLVGPTAADLTLEKQTLTSFASDLSGLETKVVQLQTKTTITSLELNSARTSADTLKTRTFQIQQSLQSAIAKLKASGEWENLDPIVLARATNLKVQSFIRNAGGAKRILEDAAVQASRLSLEIDSLVQPLSAKVASTGPSFGNNSRLGFVPVRASFAPTAPIYRESFRCRFRTGVYILTSKDADAIKMLCACYPSDPDNFCSQRT